ncbi:MAG: hypothetical protein HGA76_06235, partial [Candidatus Firestonebacteria bacterium]|nr:hypothetical protein [Candidatus Firestonebacteria bacterium]
MLNFQGIQTAFSKITALIDWQHKLRTKIVWMVLLLGGLPLTIFAFIAAQISVAYVHVNAAQQNQERANQIAGVVDAYYISRFEYIQRHFERHAGLLETGPATTAALHRLVSHLLAEFPDLVAVSGMDGWGKPRFFENRRNRHDLQDVLSKNSDFPGNNLSLAFSIKIGVPRFYPQIRDVIVPLVFHPDNRGEDRVGFMVVYFS